LLIYCASQENSGIIDNCAAWTERQWQQICGVSKKRVAAESTLWQWLDGSLIVKLYPIEKQKEVQRLRSQAKTGAHAKWDASRHPQGIASDASRQADGNAEVEGERKGKGKEGEVEGEPEWNQAPATALSGHALVPTTKPPQERLRFRLNRHGSKLDMAGKPIFHEWVDVCRGYKIGWIEKIFDEVETVPLPSDLRRILKARQSKYAAWKESQDKETERLSKEAS
jgi:hypothetical protein